MNRYIRFGITTSLLLIAPKLGIGQSTPIQRAVKVARDSILCTTSASNQQRRACVRLDSIWATPTTPVGPVCALPACNPGSPGNTGYGVTLYAAVTAAGEDSTYCGVVTRQDGVRFLTWPPVWVKWERPDSASWRVRDGDVKITVKCGHAMATAGVTDTTRISVRWLGDWATVNGKRSWSPFVSIVP